MPARTNPCRSYHATSVGAPAQQSTRRTGTSAAAATIGELRAALARGEGHEVRRLAHKLTGSARNVGATGMAALAAEVDASDADVEGVIDGLGAALAPTCAALRAALG